MSLAVHSKDFRERMQGTIDFLHDRKVIKDKKNMKNFSEVQKILNSSLADFDKISCKEDKKDKVKKVNIKKILNKHVNGVEVISDEILKFTMDPIQKVYLDFYFRYYNVNNIHIKNSSEQFALKNKTLETICNGTSRNQKTIYKYAFLVTVYIFFLYKEKNLRFNKSEITINSEDIKWLNKELKKHQECCYNMFAPYKDNKSSCPIL